MKKVLIATDFTPASRAAASYGAVLARAMDATVELLHVYWEISTATVGAEPASNRVSKLHMEKEKLMNRELEHLEERYFVQTDGNIRHGTRTRVIGRRVQETGADLVVMGMKDDHLKMLAGSTILKAFRIPNVPVLVVPERTTSMHIRNIVLAVDFDEMTTPAAFEPLYQVVQATQAFLRVVHVEKKGADTEPGEFDQKLRLASSLAKFTYEYNKVESNNIDSAILNFTDTHPADLLVMVLHHEHLLKRMFRPSHTIPVTFASKVPVLVLKSPE